MNEKSLRLTTIISITATAAILSACANGERNVPDRNAPLLALSSSGQGTQSTGVNRFLWRASLDTIDFMPIETVDAMSGLITTDWFANPNVPQERFKANVYILDTALRADALRVSVFRQQLTEFGWIDAPVNAATAQEMENAILTRARELRLNSLDD